MILKHNNLEGKDLPSLKYQKDLIRSYTLSQESFNNNNQMNPFIGFVMRLRDNIKETLLTLPTVNLSFSYDRVATDRIASASYFNARNITVACVPNMQAKMLDYIEYLEQCGDLSRRIAQTTIPDTRRFFSGILEDVAQLAGMKGAVSVEIISIYPEDKQRLVDRSMAIHKNGDKPLEVALFGNQYARMGDFVDASVRTDALIKLTKVINIDKLNKDVEFINEMVSKVILRIKQKDVEIHKDVIAKVSAFLYELAEEIAFVAAFVYNIDVLSKVMEDQTATLKEMIVR